MIFLDYLLLSLKTDKTAPIGPSSVSGLLSTEYKKRFPANVSNPGAEKSDSAVSHNYFYPRVQYKVVQGSPLITAINEGCGLLWELYDKLDDACNSQADWKIIEKRMIEKKVPFGLCNDLIKYRILTPWLALPEDNFKNYLVHENGGREKILARALEGHLRSISKSLGHDIDGEIIVRVNPKPDYIFQRDIHFAGFFGSFMTNFELPNFIGLGKSVSRGYGAIKRIDTNQATDNYGKLPRQE